MASYKINLISYDLSRKETMIQIANALEQVENLSVDIMKRIENKTSEYQKRVGNLNERITSAESKINSLKNRTNKAITVFAQPKYPDQLCKVENFEGLFFPLNEIVDSKEFSTRFDVKERQSRPDSQRIITEKQLHYSVKINDDANLEYVGFGQIPKTVDSVSNLMVFNTSLNP